MQSSTAIAIRALVMLIVLISVPLFAIFGKNLPEVVKGLLEGRSLVLGPAPGAEAGPATNAPAPVANNPFGQAGPYRATPEAGNAARSLGAAVNSAPNPFSVNGAAPAGTANAPGGGIVAGNGGALAGGNMGAVNPPGAMASNQLAATSPSNGPGNMAAGVDSMVKRVGSTSSLSTAGASSPNGVPITPALSSGAQPASFLAAPESTALAVPEPAGRDSSTAASATGGQTGSVYSGKLDSPGENTATAAAGTSDEKFRQAEMRLRELGATHYMLETWGPDNNRYRFVCKMAIGGNAEVNRYFQAIDDSPWQAMQTVLREVEQWRSRSQPQ